MPFTETLAQIPIGYFVVGAIFIAAFVADWLFPIPPLAPQGASFLYCINCARRAFLLPFIEETKWRIPMGERYDPVAFQEERRAGKLPEPSQRAAILNDSLPSIDSAIRSLNALKIALSESPEIVLGRTFQPNITGNIHPGVRTSIEVTVADNGTCAVRVTVREPDTKYGEFAFRTIIGLDGSIQTLKDNRVG